MNKKNERTLKLKEDSIYKVMQNITRYSDKYYIDAIIGFIPGGIGDAVSALFSIVHAYFCFFRLRSIPLTLAIINNTLRDILLGLIPFYVGDMIDFFHKSNVRNMSLIDGFINDDKDIIREVNKKALQTAIIIFLIIAAIIFMFFALVWLANLIGTRLFT